MELKKQIEPELEQLIQTGYEFYPSEYVKRGWALMNKDLGQFILFSLIVFFIQAAVNWITSAISALMGGGGSAFNYANGMDMDSLENLFTAGQFVSSGLGWAIGLALAPMLIGTQIVAKKLHQNEEYEFKDFFSGYQWFLPIVLVAAISGFFTGVGIVLLIIPGIYLAVAYRAAIPLVVFRNYDFWPALEASRRLITKNFWQVFALGLLMILIDLAGLLACCVGLIFTVPLTACIAYVAYADVMEQGGLMTSPDEDSGMPMGGEDMFGFDPPPPPPSGSPNVDREDPFAI